MAEKQVFYNIALSAMIRGFVDANIGTGYALAIDRVLEEIYARKQSKHSPQPTPKPL